MRLASLLLAGCATLFAADHKQVSVNGPAGAPITVDGVPAGVAPSSVSVRNRGEHTIVVGGRVCHIDASIGLGWVVLDLFSGIVPLVVDVATGAWRTIDDTGC